MAEFIVPLVGGLLIGCSALLLMLLLGRIAGISGIVWGAVSGQADNGWRWLFILGLLAGPWLYHAIAAVPFPEPPALDWPMAVAGGLLVGFGVRLGGGCTSGHGVCGIGRLSLRSLVATLVFMVYETVRYGSRPGVAFCPSRSPDSDRDDALFSSPPLGVPSVPCREGGMIPVAVIGLMVFSVCAASHL